MIKNKIANRTNNILGEIKLKTIRITDQIIKNNILKI